MLLLTGCAMIGRETKPPVVIDTSCQWVTPIYISKKDVLTDGTSRQILAHNETWKGFCKKDK